MMDREAALHFRDQLRAARSVALRDAEAHQEIVLTLERLGAYLYGKIATLNTYQGVITKLAELSPMATTVPSSLADLHSTFVRKYEIFRRGRNATVHQGAFARHLTVNAVELSLVLEEALMNGYDQVGDFMVRNPVCAYYGNRLVLSGRPCYQTLSRYLPVLTGSKQQPVWQVVSDSNLVKYLRVKGEVSSERLVQKLSEATDLGGLTLLPVQTCLANDKLANLSQGPEGLPTLVLSPTVILSWVS